MTSYTRATATARIVLPEDARLAAAMYEAGHAVARLVHRVPFEYVEIREDGTGGVVIGHPRPADRLRSAVRCLAGPVAEAAFADRPLAEVLAGNEGRADYAMARDALAPTGVAIDEAVEAARRLFWDNWPAICRVARALAERGRLDYERTREIASLPR